MAFLSHPYCSNYEDLSLLESDAWPWGHWKIDAEQVVQASQSSARIGGKTIVQDLLQQSMSKAIETALTTQGFDVAALETTMNTLSHQRPSIIPQLLRNAEHIGPSDCSAAILRLAYKGHPSLEWTKFVNLDGQTLAAALGDDDLSDAAEAIFSSSNLARDVPQAVRALDTKGFKSIYLMERPDRESDDAAMNIFLDAAASASSLARDKCLLTGLSSLALRHRLWLSSANGESDSPVHVKSFPVVQMLVCRKISAPGYLNSRASSLAMLYSHHNVA